MSNKDPINHLLGAAPSVMKSLLRFEDPSGRVIADVDTVQLTTESLVEAASDPKIQAHHVAQFKAALNTPAMASRVKFLCEEYIKDMVVDLLAERQAEIEARVRKEIESRFDAAVSRVANEQLELALARVRKAMVLP